MNEDKSKSYNDGFETGLNWKRDFRPGGPYVPSQSLHRGDAYNASVEAARIAAREWFEGFNAGLAKQKKSQ